MVGRMDEMRVGRKAERTGFLKGGKPVLRRRNMAMSLREERWVAPVAAQVVHCDIPRSGWRDTPRYVEDHRER
jgi:hypothetical protein